FAERILTQETSSVAKIFLSDLDDLHLAEQELRQWQCECIDVKPIVQQDGMTKIELLVKAVAAPPAGGAFEYGASPLGDHEHLALLDIAEPRQELMDGTRLLLEGGEIYVPIGAVAAREERMVWTAPEYGH